MASMDPGFLFPGPHTFQFWMCGDGIRKVKAWMELSLARDAKNNRKRFYRYIAQKRKAKESVLPLMDEKGELVMTDMGKAEVLNNVFASVFTASKASQVFHFPEPIDGGWGGQSPTRCD